MILINLMEPMPHINVHGTLMYDKQIVLMSSMQFSFSNETNYCKISLQPLDLGST